MEPLWWNATGSGSSDCGIGDSFTFKLRDCSPGCGKCPSQVWTNGRHQLVPVFHRGGRAKSLVSGNGALIGLRLKQKLRLSETRIFRPKPLDCRCTSIKKVTIFREFPLDHGYKYTFHSPYIHKILSLRELLLRLRQFALTKFFSHVMIAFITYT